MNSISFFILAVRGWHFLCCWKFLEGGQSPQIEGSVEACPPFLVYNKINRKRVCLQTACDIDKKIHRVKLCNLSKNDFGWEGLTFFAPLGISGGWTEPSNTWKNCRKTYFLPNGLTILVFPVGGRSTPEHSRTSTNTHPDQLIFEPFFVWGAHNSFSATAIHITKLQIIS